MPPKRIALICERCGADFLGYRYARKPGDRPQRYCSIICRGAGPRTDLATRFWAGVDTSDPLGCWPWMRATRNAQGHGGVWDGKRWTHAHRVAFFLTYGRIPDGLEICHRCDNPPCCRPDHLFLGSHARNMSDMAIKERTGNTRLTVGDVQEMRRLHRSGWGKVRLARRFGVAPSTAGRVMRYENWRHVE